MLLDEKTYLFNPFALKKITDEAISEQINELASRYKTNADVPYDIAHNIEIYANILYLYGEMIARLGERLAIIEYENDMGIKLETHNQRNEWTSNNTEKAPAISYFEGQAMKKYHLSRIKEYSIKADSDRFKKAYTSVENKMNALKDKLKSMKYEIGINYD